MLDQILSIAAQAIDDQGAIAPNATIRFEQAKVVTTDLVLDDWSNPVLQDNETETVTLECWLTKRKQPYQDTQAGIKLTHAYMEGRLVSPKIYQLPLKASGIITTTINGQEGIITEVRSLETPASVQYSLAETLGQRIAVYVQFTQ